MLTVEANKEAVRRFTEALDSHDLSAVPELCTSECAELWKQGINVDPWSDHHITLTGLVGEGDKVVAIVETRGRVVGDFFGVPGRGKPFTNRGAVVYEFDGDKISSVDPYFDDLNIATKQLGATLVPAQDA